MVGFAEILARARAGVVTVPSSWAQGRATYGGVAVALALQAARARAPDRELRSIQACFSGPLRPEVEARLEARVLRAGKGSTSVSSEVHQGDDVACAIHAVFGAGRASRVTVEPPQLLVGPGPEEGTPMPYIEGAMPVFTQQFEYRWTEGSFPFTGGDAPSHAGWIRFREPQDVGGGEHAVALVDAWPLPVLSMLSAPSASASVTWQLDLASPPADREGWWFHRAETLASGDGFAQMRSRLWAPDGRFAAASAQTVSVFA
jgi:acyl-CoA thioesterase